MEEELSTRLLSTLKYSCSNGRWTQHISPFAVTKYQRRKTIVFFSSQNKEKKSVTNGKEFNGMVKAHQFQAIQNKKAIQNKLVDVNHFKLMDVDHFKFYGYQPCQLMGLN